MSILCILVEYERPDHIWFEGFQDI